MQPAAACCDTHTHTHTADSQRVQEQEAAEAMLWDTAAAEEQVQPGSDESVEAEFSSWRRMRSLMKGC